jgi:hypothetical protein
MNARLYAALEQAIDTWMEKAADDTSWPDFHVGARTVEFMSKAARAVFDACVEAQEHEAAENRE